MQGGAKETLKLDRQNMGKYDFSQIFISEEKCRLCKKCKLSRFYIMIMQKCKSCNLYIPLTKEPRRRPGQNWQPPAMKGAGRCDREYLRIRWGEQGPIQPSNPIQPGAPFTPGSNRLLSGGSPWGVLDTRPAPPSRGGGGHQNRRTKNSLELPISRHLSPGFPG